MVSNRHTCRTTFEERITFSSTATITKDCYNVHTMDHTVVERGNKMFKLEVGGRMDTVTIDRLKRAYGDAAEPTVPAQPPIRGRPPNAGSFDHLLHLYLQTTTFLSKSIQQGTISFQQRTISFLSKTIQLQPRTTVSFHRSPRAVERVVDDNFTSQSWARGSHL